MFLCTSNLFFHCFWEFYICVQWNFIERSRASVDLEILGGTSPKISSPGYLRTSVIIWCSHHPILDVIIMRTLMMRDMRTKEMQKPGKVTQLVSGKRHTSNSGRPQGLCSRVLLKPPPSPVPPPPGSHPGCTCLYPQSHTFCLLHKILGPFLLLHWRDFFSIPSLGRWVVMIKYRGNSSH